MSGEITNYVTERPNITASDIALFGGDASRLTLALQYGYTLADIRAPGNYVARAFAGPLDADGTGAGYFFAPDNPTTGEFTVRSRISELKFADTVSGFVTTNLGSGSTFNTYVGQPAAAIGSYLYSNTIGPGTVYDRTFVQPTNTLLSGIATSPIADPAIITTLETSGVPLGEVAGSTLSGIKYLGNVAADARLAAALPTAESALGRASSLSTGLGEFKGTYTGLVNVGEAGPLQSNLAETFSGGRYDVVTLTQDTILYRAGTADQPLGQFFSRAEPQSLIRN